MSDRLAAPSEATIGEAPAFSARPSIAGSKWTMVGLFLAAFALFVIRLGHPHAYIYDEVYHAYTAGEYVRGNPDAYVWSTRAPRAGVAYMWNHPPVGLHLIGLGIRLWGDDSFGWRFMSAVFGAIGVVLLFALARALSGDARVGLIAAVLLMLDGLYFVQSRTGMLDVFGVVFMLATFLALFRYLTRSPDRATAPLLATGIGIGLGVATKWNAAYPAALIALVVAFRILAIGVVARLGTAGSPTVAMRWAGLDPVEVESGRAARTFRRQLAVAPVALILVPAIVYLVAYVPFFATGHTFAQFLELQRQIYAYHTGLKATHQYQSVWWQWPLALRPVWYYVAYHERTIENIYANVNPLLAWSFLPAVAWLTASWWRDRFAALVVVMIGFFGQWLPWALVPRIAFAYHFLPSVTFGCVAVAAACAAGIRRGGAARVLALGYVLVIAAAFVFFFPIYSGIPLSYEAFGARIWIKSWR